MGGRCSHTRGCSLALLWYDELPLGPALERGFERCFGESRDLSALVGPWQWITRTVAPATAFGSMALPLCL